jgi:RNA polymerase sigma-70 factor (ECF subfamily)
VEDGIQGAATDAALVGRLAHGDLVALGALYDRYARDIYAVAAHALGRGAAEEVVQDVFIRVWQRAPQFDAGRGSGGAWIMAIARHRIVDELRRRGRRGAAVDTIDELLAGAEDPDADVEEQASAHEEREHILEALRELPEEQRRVIVLAYFGGLTQSEIAQELGCPLGTVKKRTRLALQKLRASLAERPLVEVLERGVSELGR